MSAIGPLVIGAPVTGSWKVEPAGSMMCAANRPWPQECRPSTWSWKKTVPSSTSLYQRYCTNSTPVRSPEACAFCSGAFSVSVLPLIAVIWVAISVSGWPWPISTLMPGGRPDVLATLIWVAPAGGAVDACAAGGLLDGNGDGGEFVGGERNAVGAQAVGPGGGDIRAEPRRPAM